MRKPASKRTGSRKTPPLAAAPAARSVSVERAARLYRMVRLLADEPRTRRAVLQALRIDVRTFYRDLELLRECQVDVALDGRKYRLVTPLATARLSLPFPDPGLTLGEAEILAKGRTKIHKKMRSLLKAIQPSSPRGS
ncbi:MAG TPA: hypothetical protein PKD86_01245 [Gemmatales bacterium]|nr:hypothetical protein [Gemmatales bacterium]HMP57950.1 hypothetical protein [Gemmatales bacterium]